MSSPAEGRDVPAIGGLRRLALLVEYEGTRYHGFQCQKNASSIQERLEDAVYRLTGERRRARGAGRTDAGVHALGQVVAFDTWASYAPAVFTQALNRYLPEDISVREAREVSLDFDPRRWAVSRQYRYRILCSTSPSPLLRRHTHLVRRSLDVEAMQEAARLLEGERDFAPFSGPLPAGRDATIRKMYRCSLGREGSLIALDVVASGFLPQQVRRTAGSLLEVGLGRLSVRGFGDLAGCGIRGAAARTLPARGLCLVRVSYPDLRFTVEGGYTEESMTVMAGAR